MKFPSRPVALWLAPAHLERVTHVADEYKTVIETYQNLSPPSGISATPFCDSEGRVATRCRGCGNLMDECFRGPDCTSRAPTAREAALIEALERITTWANAYPTKIFPALDDDYYQRAHKVLKAHDMTVDRISADAMRHALQGVGRIARAALKRANR